MANLRAAILSLSGLLITWAIQAAPTPIARTTFNGEVTLSGRTDAQVPAHVTVQSWTILSVEKASQVFPMKGFFVAHLISGQLETVINDQTATHSVDDYWTVDSNQTMAVRVLGELVVLETIAVAKH